MLDQLANLWVSLDSAQRRNLVLLGAITLAALLGTIIWSNRASYGSLYSNLPTEEAAAIVEYLRSQNINYRLTDGGDTIQVDYARLYELRLELAQQGLPRTAASTGFEIFDRSGLPGTEFSNTVNYQRALEGELARSINSLTTVHSARVHLVLPHYDLYSGDHPASASVVLDTQYGGALTNSQIQGIAYLVSSAVRELQPTQVTIVDSSSNILNSPASSTSAGGLSAQQIEAERDFERNLRDQLQAMLDQTVGPHNSIVQVQVTLDFDTEQITSDTTEPLSGPGAVSQEYLVKEEYDSRAAPPGAAPGYAPESSAEAGSYSSEEQARVYLYSRIHKEIQKAPGKIQRLTIAAIIDSELKDISPRQIRDLLAAAAGIDTARGDTITVEQMALQAKDIAKKQAEETEKAAAALHSSQRTQTILRYGTTLLLAVIFAGGVMMGSRQLSSALREVGPLPSSAQPSPHADSQPRAPAPQDDSQPAGPTSADQYMDQLQQQDPEVLAREISRMMEPEDE